MPIKTRRYRKRNNKSRVTRKNKTTRRYKKQMKGGNGLIKNEEELKKSWDDETVKSWVVNDGVGTMTSIFRTDAEGKKMDYGTKDDKVNQSTFRGKINYYLTQVMEGQEGAKIEEVR